MPVTRDGSRHTHTHTHTGGGIFHKTPGEFDLSCFFSYLFLSDNTKFLSLKKFYFIISTEINEMDNNAMTFNEQMQLNMEKPTV